MIQEELTRPMKKYGEAIHDHINLRINLIGLQISKRLADFATNLISMVLLVGLLALVIIMLSFAFVFWYGSSVGPYHHGFLIVSLVYIMSGLMLYLFREKIIIDPFLRKMGPTEFGLDQDGKIAELGKIKSMKDLRKREEIMKLQVEHSSLIIQQRLQMMNEAYAPKQVIKTLLDGVLSSTTMLSRIALVVINIIRQQKKNKDEDESTPS
jgi:hypothetical protein